MCCETGLLTFATRLCDRSVIATCEQPRSARHFLQRGLTDTPSSRSYYHKQTKNTWARDDPAMLILISGCLVVAAILWSTLYAHYGLTATLRTILNFVFLQFFGLGLVVSTALW